MENMNINIEMNVEMNEEAKKISIIEKNQERKLRNARQHKELIDEKRNELAMKKEEMEETMELIKYHQQMIISCFLEKAELLKEIDYLISEIRDEEESAKDSIVNFIYPELLKEPTKTLEQEKEEDSDFFRNIDSATIESFRDQLKALMIRLGQVNDND